MLHTNRYKFPLAQIPYFFFSFHFIRSLNAIYPLKKRKKAIAILTRSFATFFLFPWRVYFTKLFHLQNQIDRYIALSYGFIVTTSLEPCEYLLLYPQELKFLLKFNRIHYYRKRMIFVLNVELRYVMEFFFKFWIFLFLNLEYIKW